MDKITKTFTRANAKNWPVNLEKILRHAWQHSEKDLLVTIEEDAETRRTKQNRLLFKWHNELAKHIETHQGQIFDSEDIHEHVSGKLLPKRVIVINNEPEIVRTKTSKLKVKVFADFLTRYEMWAASTYKCLFTQPSDLYIDALMKQIDEQS
jgi:hypothetical protein